MTTLDSPLTDFRGQLLRPGDADYDSARQLWNALHDRYPAFIARCTSTADVAAAVRFGIDAGLTIAVRGGGHSIPGLSVCDGGLMIDLQPMKAIAVDPAARRAAAQPGVLLAELDAATQEHGLATPAGEISHTGIAGLTLGGGVGWLSRMFGLACDNLVEAEVVTADGTVVMAGGDGGDLELLWGLRGGGGNFGIVTSFRYQLHPVQPMLAGIVIHPLDRGREALRLFARLSAEAPDELSLVAACITAPPAPFVPPHLQGRPIVALGMAYVGDPAEGEHWAELLRAAQPEVDLLGVMPYVAIQQQFDKGAPAGLCSYIKSEWMGGLDDAGIDSILESVATMSSPLDQLLLRQLGGAMSRVPADATAFSYRDAAFLLTIAGLWTSRDDDRSPHVEWTRNAWSNLTRLSSGGAYVNQLDGDEGASRVRSAYLPETWERLVALKRRYDPANVFRLNTNIPPTG